MRTLLFLALSLLSACTQLKSELVDVDGRTIEIVRAGEGTATVVFESGLGVDWKPWDRVASDLSGDARIFAYSRPGYGASEETTTPRDAAQIVEELRGLLASQELAPPYVLDYLAAHEVAHLVEMNHSPRFWRVVDRICDHVDRAKRWLDTHGNDLHRYGAED